MLGMVREDKEILVDQSGFWCYGGERIETSCSAKCHSSFKFVSRSFHKHLPTLTNTKGAIIGPKKKVLFSKSTAIKSSYCKKSKL